MGCCASSDHKPDLFQEDHHHDTHSSKPPEEETVKEVMSETPTPKPILPKPITPKIEHGICKNGFVSDLRNMVDVDSYRYIASKKPPLIAADQVSEVSEICSLNDSVSTVTELRDEDEMELRERVNRSPAKFRNRAPSPAGRASTAGRSPARRSEPSPNRVRSTPERQSNVNGSGRRSRSPATRTVEFGDSRSGFGRSPSARKTGKSPARSRAGQPEKTQKPEENHSEMPHSQWLPPTTNESLENPLVSLECFIFL